MPDRPVKTIEQIIHEDGRYSLQAVQLVREGLNLTVEKLRPETESGPPQRRHVSGTELCMGLRALARDRWGLMARMVLQQWNITSTRDFGEIVFLLVDHGWMRRESHDRIDDFDNVYDFTEAFDDDFNLPRNLE